MDTKDWLLITSTVLGPILAVQAQKWVEVFRERRGRKLWVPQALGVSATHGDSGRTRVRRPREGT